MKSPYQDGPATLTLAQEVDGSNPLVWLKIDGHFACYLNSSVSVKFDEGKILRFKCNQPMDGTSGVLFIENAKQFLAKVKTAKHVTIEASIYEGGAQQIEFDVAGLNWK